ncbi:MAG: HEAT repeat domain-containing protein [Planctomycetales bacterium]|nr:HEAT repeat domain-containing protein [Planctomycetales bacterium]
MSDSVGPAPTQNADELLPPVKPPSAGFLMQLFFIPMIIVSVIVCLVLLFNWLSQRSTKPEDLVKRLRSGNAASWQTALDVANLLTDNRRKELRKSPELAAEVARMLDDQLEAGKLGDRDIDLRFYLCLALGTFEIEDGFDSLVKAAKTERDRSEVRVRTAAIEAVARRINVQEKNRAAIADNQDLLGALVDASNRTDNDPTTEQRCSELRYTTAYTLGLLGTDKANEALAPMVSDSASAVRYNAATGLARWGDDRCIFPLLEMMDLEYELTLPQKLPAKVKKEPKPLTVRQRNQFFINAVRAAKLLFETNKEVDRTDLVDAMKTLQDHPDVSGSVKKEIEAALAVQ